MAARVALEYPRGHADALRSEDARRVDFAHAPRSGDWRNRLDRFNRGVCGDLARISGRATDPIRDGDLHGHGSVGVVPALAGWRSNPPAPFEAGLIVAPTRRGFRRRGNVA